MSHLGIGELEYIEAVITLYAVATQEFVISALRVPVLQVLPLHIPHIP